jgi:hypothetical protein
MADPKEPMIGKSSRPTPIDYDAPVAGMKVRDLLAVISAHGGEQLKAEQLKTHPEYFKPEHYKPEYFKPDFYKPEYFKEYQKPEFLKGDSLKEFKEGPGDPIEQIANRVADVLKSRK